MRKRIPDPESYFEGLDLPNRVISRNVLMFERLTKKALQQKHQTDMKYRADLMHHRYVLIRVLRTSGVVSVDGKSLALNEGDILLVTPYQFHHYLSVATDAIDWLFITFELAQGAEQLEGLSYQMLQADYSVNAYWDELVRLWVDEDPAERNETLPVLDRLLMHLVQVSKRSEAGELNADVAKKHEWVVQIEGLVLRSVQEGWGLEEVARQANLSDRHLRTRFEAAMGISLREYRASYQLHRALSLMRQPELSLSDVAELSGFNSQPSFTRFIKRMTGSAPREIRSSL